MKLSARDKVIPGYILGFRIPRTGFQCLSVELGIRIPIVGGSPYSKTQDSGFHKQNFPGFWIPDSLPLHGVTCMVIETAQNWARMGSESMAHEAEGRIGYWLRGHEGERNNCFSKIQLVGKKYRDKTTLASKTRFSHHCFGFQSCRFSLPVGYNI